MRAAQFGRMGKLLVADLLGEALRARLHVRARARQADVHRLDAEGRHRVEHLDHLVVVGVAHGGALEPVAQRLVVDLGRGAVRLRPAPSRGVPVVDQVAAVGPCPRTARAGPVAGDSIRPETTGRPRRRRGGATWGACAARVRSACLAPGGPSVVCRSGGPRPCVMKFGGTSLGDRERIDTVVALVRRHGSPRKPVVVCSAHSGVTDMLLAGARAAANGQPDLAPVARARARGARRASASRPRSWTTSWAGSSRCSRASRCCGELTPRSLDAVARSASGCPCKTIAARSCEAPEAPGDVPCRPTRPGSSPTAVHARDAAARGVREPASSTSRG